MFRRHVVLPHMLAEVTMGTAQKRWTMVAVVLGSGIVFLDSTVVTLALPKIGQELTSNLFGVLEAQSYIYYGYLLALSALLILAGALSDFHGRRRMFGIGLAGFGITSLMCGLAPNLELLIVFRILQGATGAILVPSSLAIITASFQGEEQGRAFGVWAGASAATTILGPFAGGLLVNSISWRAAFFINVPLVVVAYWATARFVPESKDEQASGQFDWLGATVVALAVGGLSFGAIRGQQQEWQDVAAFIALGVGAVAAVAFPFLMARSRHPLVPLELFRSRNFTVTNLSTLVIYGALYVTFSFMGIFLIGTLGYNEPTAGLAGIPGTLLLALFSTRFGKLAARYGPRLFMTAGPAIMGLGLLWFARIPASSKGWVFGSGPGQSFLPPVDYLLDLLPGYVIFGIGLVIMVAPLTTALMTSVPSVKSGVASAVNNAISRVGPQLAGALIFVVIAGSFYSGLQERVPQLDTSSAQVRGEFSPLNRPTVEVSPSVAVAVREQSTDSLHLAMLIAAGLLLLGAAINGVGITNRPTVPEVAAPEALTPDVSERAVTEPAPILVGEPEGVIAGEGQCVACPPAPASVIIRPSGEDEAGLSSGGTHRS
jgi:EmrB/QacA subfamily drug resistance transporter